MKVETTNEAGVDAKHVLTIPCKKEFFLRSEKKLKIYSMRYSIKIKMKMGVAILFVMLGFYGCMEQDEMYRQYVPDGGIIYPCKAENAFTKPGIGRVYISWLNTTSTVTRAGIWWNDNADSTFVENITAAMDTVTVSVEVPEGIYSFFIKTYDKHGNVSVPVEVIGRSIGSNYMSGFYHRTINGYRTKGANNLIISWDDADDSKGALTNEIIYTASDNTEKTLLISVSEKVTEIDDYKAGTEFKYNTSYQPDPEEDLIISTDYRTITGVYVFLEKSIGSVIAVSTTWNDPTCQPAGAYDGNYTTRWHSNNSGYPHFITVDLGMETSIRRLAIWPSIYPGYPDPRMPSLIEWEVSMDNVAWTNLGEYNYLYDPTQTNRNPREYFFSSVSARYILLRGLDDPDGRSIMTLGEIDVYTSIGNPSDLPTPPNP